jgi:hypothetical protein
MAKTSVVVALGVGAATSETSFLVVEVAFLVTFLEVALAFLVVVTCPVVVEQGVPAAVVASLQFPALFLSELLIHFSHGLVQDPYASNTTLLKQLYFHKMADILRRRLRLCLN